MDNHEEFDAIMKEIIDGLTGNPIRDIAYLRKKSREYHNHKLGRAISSACCELALSCAPKQVRERMLHSIEERVDSIGADLERASFLVFHDRFDKALELVEEVEMRICSGKHQDSETEEYRWFSETFEESLYHRIYKPTADIVDVGLFFPWAYQLHGSILAETGDLENARVMLKKALYYNPVDFDLNAKYIETFKEDQHSDTFFETTVDAFKIAFRPEHLARCYWNLGRCFRTKGLHEAANVCYYLSLRYKPAAKARSALFEIERETGTFFREPAEERIAEIAAQYGFPTGPDAGILDLANRSARFFLARRQYEDALYFLQIEFGLTESDETEALIDKAEAELLEKCRQEENEAEDTPDGEEEED